MIEKEHTTGRAMRATGSRIRDLTGYDEQLVQGTGTETAISLLERVCGCARDQVVRLTPGERDLLLAAIYQSTYSSRIEGTVRCSTCGQPFDVHFMLDDLLQTVRQSAEDVSIEHLPDQTFRTADGVRFRLPTGEDELAVHGLTPIEAEREILRRCVIEATGHGETESVQDAMERVSPILDLSLDARCPDCSASQKVDFDLQLYLLQALLQERKQLWRDTHTLAAAYHWSPHDILGLPRGNRRFLVSLIEGEAARRTGI